MLNKFPKFLVGTLLKKRLLPKIGAAPRPQCHGDLAGSGGRLRLFQPATRACSYSSSSTSSALEWTTIRSLSNCHIDGMDPSPQINLIFSPDIPVADISWPTANAPDMCSQPGKHHVAYHAWGLNTPNFAVLPSAPIPAGKTLPGVAGMGNPRAGRSQSLSRRERD